MRPRETCEGSRGPLSPITYTLINPVCCPNIGVHFRVSPFQARVRNLGTCRLDVKGAVQVEDPQGPEYRCEAQGRTGL